MKLKPVSVECPSALFLGILKLLHSQQIGCSINLMYTIYTVIL